MLQYAVIKGEAEDRKALIKLVTERISSNLGEMIMDFRQESLIEGRQQGHFEEKLDIARRLLEEGSGADFVAKITGLPLEKILKLAEFTEH